MKINGIDLTNLLTQIRAFLMLLIGFIVVVLLFGTVIKACGHSFAWLPALDATPMAYLALGYWAAR